jgi:hypothetical protein
LNKKKKPSNALSRTRRFENEQNTTYQQKIMGGIPLPWVGGNPDLPMHPTFGGMHRHSEQFGTASHFGKFR